MREIEGIEEVIAQLKPHYGLIQQHFEQENGAFIDHITSSAHDTLGRVLKSHLVVEHYVERFLVAHFRIDNLQNVRLSFTQNVRAASYSATAAPFVKTGVLQLNRIRNRFGHSLGKDLSIQDLGPIGTVVGIAGPRRKFESPVATIEAFTTVAAAFLIVPPPAPAIDIRRDVCIGSAASRRAGLSAERSSG